MKKLLIIGVMLIPLFGFAESKKLDTLHIHHDSQLPTVAIVMTGGTISEKTDPKTGASIPVSSGADLLETIPALKNLANYKIVHFSNIDSSQMTPEIWAKLSQTVDKILEDDNIVGAVITHGTDTMAEGAFFLDITLKTKKNVVFTGAMRNASDPYSDGPPNLINSVVQAISPRANDWGVTVNMNQYIQSAYWVEKTQTTNPQTFMSGDKGYLGYVYDKKVVYRYNDRLFQMNFPIPKKLPKVAIISDFAGSTGDGVKFAVDHEKVDGIVIISVGAGNVNESMYYGIKYAIEKGVTVVITSRVLYGGVFPAYGDIGGGASLLKLGAILGGNLHAPKARLLLMLALPLYKGNTEKLTEIYHRPIR